MTVCDYAIILSMTATFASPEICFKRLIETFESTTGATMMLILFCRQVINK